MSQQGKKKKKARKPENNARKDDSDDSLDEIKRDKTTRGFDPRTVESTPDGNPRDSIVSSLDGYEPLTITKNMKSKSNTGYSNKKPNAR